MERAQLTFEAPDSGLWTNDRVHFFRPGTAIGVQAGASALDGRDLSDARYGVLSGRRDRASVNRFAYSRARDLVPRPPGDEAEAREAWLRAAREHPVASARLAAAEHVFPERIWRADLVEWDERRKPAAMAHTRELAAIEVGTLDDGALMTHVRDCIQHLRAMMSLHHEFNGTWQIPLGDFLAHASDWTGQPPGALAATLEGASPASAGIVSELTELVRLLRINATARTLVDDGRDAAGALDDLVVLDGEVGAAARNYIYTVGYRVVGGFDPMDEYALEHPAGLIATIRDAIESDPVLSDAREAIESAREAVPAAHRGEFDAMLAETRLTFRVKDERALFANTPVAGLVRRSFIDAGRRLQERGELADAEHAAEASVEELERLIAGSVDLSEELAGRYEFRSTYTSNDAPQRLGAAIEEPPPLEWLPDAASRVARAAATTQAGIGALAGEPSQTASAIILTGAGVSAGSYTGPARLVMSPGDITRVEAGDVLVAIATNPGYTSVMNICGAIITDAGGPLSHAAIVARELGVPAVVGTSIATTTLEDGAVVTVDGATGEVRAG